MGILKSIFNWISGAAKKVAGAMGFGKDIANQIKGYADSPLLDVVVNLTTTPYDNVALAYVRTGLTILIKDLGWGEKKISDFSDSSLPHVLNTLNAESAKLNADFKNIPLTRQQAIAGAQVVYNPNIINN
jgi:hypothetical protein